MGEGIPTAPVAGGSLIAGFAVARYTKIRPLGGIPLALGGGWCAQEWYRRRGRPTALALGSIYLAGFVGSHPLARRIGAWPSVLTVGRRQQRRGVGPRRPRLVRARVGDPRHVDHDLAGRERIRSASGSACSRATAGLSGPSARLTASNSSST